MASGQSSSYKQLGELGFQDGKSQTGADHATVYFAAVVGSFRVITDRRSIMYYERNELNELMFHV